MYLVWYMCILVYMWNVRKLYVSAMQIQWKHIHNNISESLLLAETAQFEER
jgi:hypothetical protein